MKYYIVDTNVYISAFRGYYSMDICPEYWDILTQIGNENLLISPIEVRNEILRQDDELARWVKAKNPCFQTATLPEITPFFLEVVEAYKKAKENAKLKFQETNPTYRLPRKESLSDEDMMVVANALFYREHFPSKEVVIVTKETDLSLYKKPVKIPHVCDPLGISYVNDFEFIKEVGIRFKALRS